jgi:hypothetical protein
MRTGAPINVTLIRLGTRHYTSTGLTIPFGGKWQLEIKALVSQIDEVDVNAVGSDPLLIESSERAYNTSRV